LIQELLYKSSDAMLGSFGNSKVGIGSDLSVNIYLASFTDGASIILSLMASLALASSKSL